MSLNVLQYRQNVLWMPKKYTCAENVVKIHYYRITLQGGGCVSLVVVTTRNFKCGYLGVVLFRRINMKQNCKEANENCSNFSFSTGSNSNNSRAV